MRVWVNLADGGQRQLLATNDRTAKIYAAAPPDLITYLELKYGPIMSIATETEDRITWRKPDEAHR